MAEPHPAVHLMSVWEVNVNVSELCSNGICGTERHLVESHLAIPHSVQQQLKQPVAWGYPAAYFHFPGF